MLALTIAMALWGVSSEIGKAGLENRAGGWRTATLSIMTFAAPVLNP